MITRIACVVVAACLIVASAPAGGSKGVAELQGRWRLVMLKTENDDIGTPGFRPELVIRGKQMLYGGSEIGRIDVDMSSSPKTLDVHFTNPERTYEGVYTLEMDVLKICLNGHSQGVKERPASFSVEGHPAWRLCSFERVKPGSEEPDKGFVGVALRVDKERPEVIVGSTLEASPARKAGLRKDDVVVAIGGVRVQDLRAAVDAVRLAKPGSDLAFQLRRDGKQHDVMVKVAVLPLPLVLGLE